MSFIVGRYTATWDGLACGQTAEGLRIIHQFFKRLIMGDAYAEAPQDAVYRGGEVALAFRLIEYDAAAVQSLKWPYSVTKWDMGAVGRTDVGSLLAKAMIFTAVAGTPAQTTPSSLTFSKSILHENFPVDVLFAPDLREIPLRMRVYPVNGVFGTETP